MIFKNNKMMLIRIFCIAFVLFIVVFRLVSLHNVLINCVMKDQWRFLKLVESYYEGNFKLYDLTQLSSHLKVGYMALFLGNALLFNLNTYAELIFSMALFSVSLWLIYSGLRRSGLKEDSFLFLVTFVVLTLIVMSEAKHAYFRYNVLAVGNSSGLLIFLIILTIADRYICKLQASPLSLAALGFSTVFMGVGFGGGRMPAFFVATLIPLIILILLVPEQRRRIFEYCGVFLFITVLLQIWYWNNVSTGVPAVGYGFGAILSDLPGATVFALRALAASILHDVSIKKFVFVEQVLIGGAVTSLYIFATWLFFRLRIWKNTVIPISLMIYATCYIGLILIARFGLGFDNATAPRYSGEILVGLIGVFWIYGIAIGRVPCSKFRFALIILMLFSVSLVELSNLSAASRHDEALKRQLGKQVVLLKEMKYDKLAKWFGTAKGYKPVIEGDQIMRRYKLGPYSETN